jgi:hypothetical protein
MGMMAMSKEEIEVGDVWQYKNGIKMVVIRKETSTDIFREGSKEITSFVVIEDDGEPNIHEDIVFFTNFTYLGKSKAKLEDLFNVEEEENEKDNLATDLKQIVRDSAKYAREIIDSWSKGAV